LTGLLVDKAMEPINQILPKADSEEDKAVFLNNAARLRQQGIAFSTMAWCSIDDLEILKKLDQQNKLPLYVDVLIDGLDPNLDQLLEQGPQISASGKLRIAGIKFFADGAMGSAGARLLSPYRSG